MTSWYCNPAARDWNCSAVPGDARAFHRSLPGYAPTPLVPVPELAAEFGLGQLLVKDESARLGLAAFKVLGASWAWPPGAQSRARAHPGGGDARKHRPAG